MKNLAKILWNGTMVVTLGLTLIGMAEKDNRYFIGAMGTAFIGVTASVIVGSRERYKINNQEDIKKNYNQKQQK